MDDPVARVLRCIEKNPTIRQAGTLTPNFLNNVAQVFETYGFATTRQFLKAQCERESMADQARAVLAALDCMEQCEAIHLNRAVGRLLIKTLNQSARCGRATQGGNR